MGIGDRIKQRRRELNLTQTQLAELAGVSKGTIGNYESNICAPNEKVLFKLFEVLDCDANYLYQDSRLGKRSSNRISDREAALIKKYRRLDAHGVKVVDFVVEEEYSRCLATEENIPVIKIKHSIYKVSAGLGFDLNDEDEWEEIDIPDTPDSRRADFALTIKGNSMEPEYHDGQIVLVKCQPAVDIGETGIFVVNGSGYIKRNGGDRLISVNPDYKDIMLSEYDFISCAGKVIGSIN